jgi:hypothetical protein
MRSISRVRLCLAGPTVIRTRTIIPASTLAALIFVHPFFQRKSRGHRRGFGYAVVPSDHCEDLKISLYLQVLDD